MSTEAKLAVSPADLADEEIIARVLDGDIEAYAGIMRHHNQRMFRVARSIVKDDAEAMDVVQESFITAFERLGDLKNTAALSTWIARIVRNTALMKLRKSRRMQYMDEPDFENVLSMTDNKPRPELPEAALANKELRELLVTCIDELPDAFREVFMLRAIEQCSVDETAAIVDIETGTVKSRFHRARQLLQSRIMEHCDAAGVTVHEFAGHRCDTIVRNVMQTIRQKSANTSPAPAD
jgi:RNA polymerase sigma-70 factor, ECF subfamily